MSQSNIIFGFLFAAFVVYITQRGELPVYLGFLLSAPAAPDNSSQGATPAATPASGTNTSDATSEIIKYAPEILSAIG